MARVLVVAGLVIAGIGLAMMAGIPVGRLPGDIVIRRGNFTFYFPVVTSIVVSLVITVIVSFLRR